MSAKESSEVSRGLDETEGGVWRGIVELLLAQGDTISEAMRLADGLIRERREQRGKKVALRRARSGTIVKQHAVPEQPSKLPPVVRVSTLRVPR